MKKLKQILIVAFFLIAVSCAGTSTKEYDFALWREKGITSLETIELGGQPHSALIRGTNTENPLLIVVHGYAVPMMPFAHLDYADPDANDGVTGEMEKNFIVVNYDQRGTGKTSGLGSRQNPIKIEQLVSDAEELVEIMRKRFHKEKVYILGISFGSIIGMKLVEKRPDMFHAYISEGQAVNLPETYGHARNFILEQAEKQKNEKVLKEMKTVMLPSPDQPLEMNMENTNTILEHLDAYSQKIYHLNDLHSFFLKSLWNAPEYSFSDMMNTLQAIDLFTKATMQELVAVDMRKEVPRVDVPVYFIMGEYDVMKYSARDYFMKLNAKEKFWIVIKKAGHAASADNPKDVLDVYLNKVL